MSRKFLVYQRTRDTVDIMAEEIEVPDGQEPEKFIGKIFEQWNNTEDERAKMTADDLDCVIRENMTGDEKKTWKYKPQYRDLVLIYDLNQTIEEKPVEQVKVEQIEYCTSTKVNLVSLRSGADVYQCSKCGRFRLRIGFGDFTEGVCNPDLLCTKCQQVFTSQEEFKAHLKERPHRKPNWLKEIGR